MDYIGIQRKIDFGRGKEAQVLGVPHDVYRPTVSGDVKQAGNKVAAGIRVRHNIGISTPFKRALETELRKGIIWYEIIADMSAFKVGDVFFNVDSAYRKGSIEVTWDTQEFSGFCLASHPTVRMTLGARLNMFAQILRSESATVQSGGPSTQPHFNPAASQGNPVIITNGLASVGTSVDTGALIPIGLQARETGSAGKTLPGVPDSMHDATFVAYVPPLNGFKFVPDDKLKTQDGAVYRVIVAFSQDTGVVGSQLLLQQEQPGNC